MHVPDDGVAHPPAVSSSVVPPNPPAVAAAAAGIAGLEVEQQQQQQWQAPTIDAGDGDGGGGFAGEEGGAAGGYGYDHGHDGANGNGAWVEDSRMVDVVRSLAQRCRGRPQRAEQAGTGGGDGDVEGERGGSSTEGVGASMESEGRGGGGGDGAAAWPVGSLTLPELAEAVLEAVGPEATGDVLAACPELLENVPPKVRAGDDGDGGGGDGHSAVGLGGMLESTQKNTMSLGSACVAKVIPRCSLRAWYVEGWAGGGNAPAPSTVCTLLFHCIMHGVALPSPSLSSHSGWQALSVLRSGVLVPFPSLPFPSLPVLI